MWCGVVWCGVWCGVVWCGVVWCGVMWCDVVRCGVVWCGVVWCGVVWHRTSRVNEASEAAMISEVLPLRWCGFGNHFCLNHPPSHLRPLLSIYNGYHLTATCLAMEAADSLAKEGTTKEQVDRSTSYPEVKLEDHPQGQATQQVEAQAPTVQQG